MELGGKIKRILKREGVKLSWGGKIKKDFCLTLWNTFRLILWEIKILSWGPAWRGDIQILKEIIKGIFQIL